MFCFTELMRAFSWCGLDGHGMSPLSQLTEVHVYELALSQSRNEHISTSWESIDGNQRRYFMYHHSCFFFFFQDALSRPLMHEKDAGRWTMSIAVGGSINQCNVTSRKT